LIRILLLITLFFTSTAYAGIEAYQFDSPQKESDYNQLINELRCLVCQNQNLSGSDAALAKDLRRETYEMVKAGKSQQQVKEFMVARYGDFVLYRPQFQFNTYLLWLGPFVLLLLVIILVFRRFRNSDEAVSADAESLQQARQLLEKEEPRT
jgi:cytochrome c-type biogenesis protein CcmH